MKNLTSLLLLLLLGTGYLFAGKNKPLFPQTPGMVSYTYRNDFQKDVAATLDTLRTMGIKDMEFSSLFGKKASDLRKMLDERKMFCSSFGVSYADLTEKIHEVGQNAKTLGAKYVRVASIPHKKSFTLEDAQKAVADFNEAGKILKKEFGINFCYHNHGFEFYPYDAGTLYDYIVQKTDPRYVSFELDILWAFFPGADPVQLLNKYGKRFKLMHLKDLKKGVVGDLSGKTSNENDVALGTGQLDIPAILKAAKKAGIKHYYIEDENPGYKKQVPHTMEYLKSCNSIANDNPESGISIKGDKWYFNSKITNPVSPAEGLLMNIRMVNSVFEDRGEGMSKLIANFDPMANTDAFISKIPEYAAGGVNAFTISLQGGSPGYEGAVNTAFNYDGALRKEYLTRVEKVIRACDANNTAVILSCFYQRQHSHVSALTGKKSIMNAMENTVNWITEKKFTNVLLEVSNEYRHGGYKNWPDGEWLMSDAGQVELIRLAKRLNPSLLVSTSAMGDGKYNEPLAQETDYITVHFNNTSLEDYQSRIEALKKYGKPIICNEDDKLMREAAIALSLSTLNGCGWGYMNVKRNQETPFEYLGTKDDTAVYQMFRNVATPGYQINPGSMKQTSLTITYPNDGMIFRTGQNIDIKLSHLYPENSIPYRIEILANRQPIAQIDRKLRAAWQLSDTGVFVLEAVVKDMEGKELYRSPKVDIIVRSDK